MIHEVDIQGVRMLTLRQHTGAGTGSATRYVLNIPQLGFNSYTFTDISATFFDKAREVFSQHKDRMDFRKLDITRDPVSFASFFLNIVSATHNQYCVICVSRRSC